MKTEPARNRTTAEAWNDFLARSALDLTSCLRKAVTPLRSVTVFQSFPLFRFCAFAVLLLPVCLLAATNDLTSTLQRGLFEEEANHNLDAAAQAYQTVSVQFDKDRKLAATAIFRLGEVYRKQGKTNEATAQYERIVREFSDQQTLVTLSRQNLGVLKRAPGLGDVPILTGPREATASDAALLERIKKLSLAEARQVMPSLVPDELLTKLLAQYQATELKRTQPTANGLQDNTLDGQLKLLDEQIAARIKGIIKALEIRVAAAAGGPVGASEENAVAGSPLDDEENEIRRLQAMIQNSPDLINAARGEEGTPLYQAASKGQLQVAKFLLDHGAAINAPNGIGGKIWSGWTPLIGAANSGHKAMVELLLGRGADVNVRDRQGLSALHHAAQRGFTGVIEALLANKADVNARDSNGATPLHLALLESPKAVIELLLAHGADVNAGTEKDFQTGKFGTVSGTPLHVALRRGEPALVELLLDHKADVNVPAKGGTFFNGRTPLQEAGSDTALVELLLRHGADPNAGVKDLPLAAAARAGKIETARALLQAGAKPDLAGKVSYQSIGPPGQPESFGGAESGFGPYTPLQIAVSRRDAAMVKLLLEFKADPNSKGPWSTPPSPLIRWTLGEPEILRTFLDAGADANAEAQPGLPLLHTATANRQAEAVELLLAHGVKPDILSNDKRTPLSVAVEVNCLRCAEALLAAKADPDARFGDGFTPLLWAASNGSKDMAEALIARGADLNATDKVGWTALHKAAGAGQKEMVELLLAKGANPNVRTKDGSTPLDLAQSLVNRLSAGATIESRRAFRDEIIALLHQHGAVDDLPDFTGICVTRAGVAKPILVFAKDAASINRFTLLEVIENFYFNVLESRGLLFPDFSKIVIHRPVAGKGAGQTKITVNLLNDSNSFDCAKDMWLEFGDVIEIPEREHTLAEAPLGLTEAQLKELGQCLKGTVTFVVRGQKAEVTLNGDLGSGWLSSALDRVKNLLRSSSDMSHVKIKRTDPATKQTKEFVADAAQTGWNRAWLRDGDVIEVPDKP